jgi:O-antigen ligase
VIGPLVARRRQLAVWAILPAALALSLVTGTGIAIGGTYRTAAIGLGVSAIVGTGAWIVSRRAGVAFVAVEGPILLLLASGLVFRTRDADALATNPLDSAGLFRVACIGGALLLGFLALSTPARHPGRVTTRPFRLYGAYVAVVFIGALPSVNVPLTAYRGVELATGLIVLAGAFRVSGPEALRRVEYVLYWWIAFVVLSTWLGVLFFPGEALSEQTRSPIPLQLHGVLPVISSNGLGILGVMLLIWTIAQRVFPGEFRHAGRGASYLLAPLGLATLVMAQYRTGYVAAAIGLLLLIALRSRMAVVWVLLAGVVAASLWGALVLDRAEPVLLRGQSPDEAALLSSRLVFWENAIPVWQESPLIGRGLLTGTRFEVLAELGRTDVSTIHGTWIEALVGTGLVGIALLLAGIVVTYARAFRESFRPYGRAVPILLLTVLLVRSLTGSTFEVFGLFSIVVLVISLGLRDRNAIQRPIRQQRVEPS